MNEKDILVRALSKNEEVRAFALTDKGIVEEARSLHETTPIATEALGRTLSAGLILGDMMKEKGDLVTIQFFGDGGLKHILVTSDFEGQVKGYVSVPGYTALSKGEEGDDIRKGIGRGTLTVIRDYHLKEPYSSQIAIHTGDIAGDLTYYFSQSEQTPTSVGLDVLLGADGSVLASGGYLIQLMPFASQKTIDTLVRNLSRPFPIAQYLVSHTPEELLSVVLDGFDPQITGSKDVSWHCSCSEERGKMVIATLGRKEIEEMIRENKPVEASCVFCGKKYTYTKEELEEILSSLPQEKRAA